MAKKSRQDKQIDTLIERAYMATCSGIAISIMDMGKIYTAGRAAFARGEDLHVAVRAFVETIRQN